ncbi:unnamed protein product [Parascedosporium putredinis]|uniref:Solute carrier family 40 member n=1 Tax=Parascedosporium putredinis TaxID=1442378 RepID=A0A9P1H1C6_9PEZI|nr:unnamed protein product [Parascedosporium putredinis]CAI7993529.1 unnamed protein product [Parascedosporium putredinis]
MESAAPRPRDDGVDALSTSAVRRLYVSHFLSAWNSRFFEFGSTLFLASIYPHTLVPTSVYALARAGFAMVFAPAVGRWIDKSDRLFVVQASIIGQRVSVAISCLILYLLARWRDWGAHSTRGLFAIIVLLAGVEKLCSVMNSVSVTKDWIVVMTEENEHVRKILNARIRRIDLVCKLLGPFVVASIDDYSTIVAIWTTMILTLLSVGPEYKFIAQTYYSVPGLAKPRGRQAQAASRSTGSGESDEEEPLIGDRTPGANPTAPRRQSLLTTIFPLASLKFYAHHRAFLPSLAYVFLHLTVLSFSGRMIVFLLSIGYSSLTVGIARTVCTIVELSATWTTPKLIGRFGNVMTGFYSITWQVLTLSLGAACFVIDWDAVLRTTDIGALIGAGGLVIIVQDEVEEESRGAFSTAEASSQNLFEMLSYVSTIVYYKPEEFQWPMFITLASMYAGWATYAIYVYRGKRQSEVY